MGNFFSSDLSELSEKNNEIRNLKADLRNLQRDYNDLLDENADLMEQVDNCEDENDRKEKNIIDLTSQLNQLPYSKNAYQTKEFKDLLKYMNKINKK